MERNQIVNTVLERKKVIFKSSSNFYPKSIIKTVNILFSNTVLFRLILESRGVVSEWKSIGPSDWMHSICGMFRQIYPVHIWIL